MIIATFMVLKKRSSASNSGGYISAKSAIDEKDKELSDLLSEANDLASTGEVEYVTEQLSQLESSLLSEKESLKAIEAKLDVAQSNVEQKESQQQEIKSSKEEDEAKLATLLSNFADINNESVSLEQNLASSLRDLDSILGELELSVDQRRVFQDLSDSLGNAGGRLRDLITEYEGVNQRLKALKQQHSDLEDEYTKLVEQQLGA
jgi:chromosome segregation ATPase